MQEKIFKDEKNWYLATNITILARKHFGFRKIGKYLYMTPIRRSK
jgi:hypothetical protein